MTGRNHILVDLDQSTDIAAVGGKAFNLCRVRQLGIPTPDGVVVPDSLLARHLQEAGVASDVDSLLDGLDSWTDSRIAGASSAIRERITTTALAADLRSALQARYNFSRGNQPLVVRSSALGEDSGTTSFAGQLDSFLGIDSFVELENAIRATWSSLFSVRVLLYSRHNGMRIRHMGVLIQPQVDARLSGVLFTRDPSGQNPDVMLVEYGVGLGDSLVSGRITPRRARIGREDLEIVVESAENRVDVAGPEDMDVIKNIARMSLTLEQENGVAQDVEWCIDVTGKPAIVQARTATRIGTIKKNGQVHWSNANIAENFPGPVSPFLFSIVKPGYSAYFRNLGAGFGVSRKRISAMAGPLDGIVGLQRGRLYYNLSNIHTLLRMMPAGRRLVEYFDLFVGAASTPAPPEIPLGVIARMGETARIVGSVLSQYLSIQKRIQRFEKRVDNFADRTHPSHLPSIDAEALINHLDEFLNIRLRQWNDAALADTAAMVCYGLLKAVLTKSLADGDHIAIHNNLLKGLPNLASAVPVTQLWQLSRRIQEDQALKKLFEEEDTAIVLKELSDVRHADFREALEEYFDKWGFRSSGELMLTTPTPQEDPAPVLRLLSTYVSAQVPSPDVISDRQRRERISATSEVIAQISRGKWWRRLPLLSAAGRFRVLLRATQGAIQLRERARMKQALLYTRLRHIALTLGERLVERGVLTDKNDVFMLSVDEVKTAISGQDEGFIAAISRSVKERREYLVHCETREPPDHLVLAEGEQWQASDQAALDTDSDAGIQTLRGSAACGGSVVGSAAVILDVAYSDGVKPGQILVTRQTDPGWATVFFLIKGLVVERGGMLSHGAIIAREYGIPAVVAVPEATRIINDGDTVTVDGDRGLVKIERH